MRCGRCRGVGGAGRAQHRGLPTGRFLFEGFLPPKRGARHERIEELRGIEATLVLFETGAADRGPRSRILRPGWASARPQSAAS